MKTKVLAVCCASIGALMPAVAASNVIIDWNNLLLQAVKDTSTNPPNASRAMAMTSTAVFDAVNSIEGNFKPYHFTGFAAAGASGEAAAVQAAHDVMLHLFPTQAKALNDALSASLAGLQGSTGMAAGVTLGAAAAQSIIGLRSADGSGTTVSYVPGSEPGQWRPTPPNGAPALLPNWPTVTPFAMTSGAQFRAPRPPCADQPRLCRCLQRC